MKLKIAENLKRLRKQKDLTQEELAGILGVSFQAISKWERDDGYPDITFLPTIANYFDVTVDELIGMDQIMTEKELSRTYRLNYEYIENREYDKAVRLLRDALKITPNNYSLLTGLAMALYFKSTETEFDTELKKEAITLCERVLAGSTTEKNRSTTRTSLCLLYKSIGDNEKAIESAKTLPHFWESRELIVPSLYDKGDYEEKLKDSIRLILSTVHEKITDINNDRISMTDISRFITLGPKNYDFQDDFMKEALEIISNFIS